MTDTETLADVIADCIRDATAPLLAKIALLEARPVLVPELKGLAEILGDVRERLAAVEARAPIPGPVGPQGPRGEPGIQGPPGHDGDEGAVGPVGPKGADGLNGKDGRDGLDGKDGAAGLNGKDGRDGLPGVPGRWGDKGDPGLDGKDGKPGRDGTNGTNGIDGKDGLGFDDVDIVFDQTKGWLVQFAKGDRVRHIPVPLPYDAGIWEHGRSYTKGAGVTVNGAWWIAQDVTRTRPGDGSAESARAWRLAVKGGRDGKPGKDGKDAEPV